MADNKTNGQNGQGATKELSVNEKELIKLAIKAEVAKMKDPTGSTQPPSNPSWNDSLNALIANGMTEDEIKTIADFNGGIRTTLSVNQWSEEALKYAKKYIDTSKIKLEGAEMELIKIGGKFEDWYKKQPNMKNRKAFKGDKLTAIDIFSYAVGNNIEIPRDIMTAFHYRVDKQKIGVLDYSVLTKISNLMMSA